MNRLTIASGARAGEVFDLAGGNITIGRDASAANIIIDDPAVATVHCRIAAVKGGGFGIQDLGTDSGTFVNDKKVSAARLSNGDRVRTGSVEFIYHTTEAAAAPVAPPPPAPAPKPAADSSLAGKTLGGYEIINVVGRGGMGAVYKATQTSLHRTVALKVLSPQLAKDQKFVDMFLREARAAAQLHHQNVVTIFDVGSDAGVHYYSMELFEGGSVEQLLKKEKKLSVERSLEIARDAARALEFAESKRLVHRDVKPDNLMLTSHGIAKLADLGLATPRGTSDSLRCGTPHFAAPEAIRGAGNDNRSDLYSLGATLFRMLTGRTPFQGATIQEILDGVLNHEAPALRTIDNTIPESVEALTAKLLQKDPARRAANAREIVDTIDSILAPAQKPHHTGKIAAIVAILVAGAAAGIYFAIKPPDSIETKPVIVRDTAEEERLRNENTQKEKTMREQAAELAFTKAKAENLTVADRIVKYEQIAAEFAETGAAVSAAAEAKKIRDEQTAAAAREAERQQLLTTFTAALDDGLKTRLDESRFPEALQFARTLPGFEAVKADADGKAIIDNIPKRVAGALDSYIKTKIQTLADDKAAGNFDAAETNSKRLLDMIGTVLTVSPDDLPEVYAANLRSYKSTVEATRALLTKSREEFAKAAETASRVALTKILVELLDVTKLDANKLDPSKPTLPFATDALNGGGSAVAAELQSLFADVTSDAAAASVMFANLFAASEKKTLGNEPWTDPGTGKAGRIVSIDASGVRLDVKGTPAGAATVVPFVNFTNGGLLAQLFARVADKSASGQLTLAKACLYAAHLYDVAPLRKSQLSLKLTENSPLAAVSANDDAFREAFEAARAAQAAGAPAEEANLLIARIERERAAARSWHDGIVTFSRGAFVDAEASLSNFIKNYRNTVAFALATNGTGGEKPQSSPAR
ncbi:MAG: protein kinase domain-containing protein [Planctomycetota bacterium]